MPSHPLARERGILVVSDRAVYRAGLVSIVEQTGCYAGHGSAAEPAALAAALQANGPWAAMVVADDTPGALSVLGTLHTEHPSLFLLLVLIEGDADVVTAGLGVGVRAFLDATSSPSEVRAALSSVEAGGCFFSRRALDLLRDRARDPAHRAPHASCLSPRQREVLVLVAQGLSTAEIAELLGVSPRTIDSHRFAISKRLGMRGAADLIRYALRERLIEG